MVKFGYTNHTAINVKSGEALNSILYIQNNQFLARTPTVILIRSPVPLLKLEASLRPTVRRPIISSLVRPR